MPPGPPIKNRTSPISNVGSEVARDPFDDFDGVHFTKAPRPGASTAPDVDTRRFTADPVKPHFAEPTEGKDLVYYPAPVPVMLNLPPKLSNPRGQSHASAPKPGPEDPQVKRDAATSFRRSLALKAYRSKADVSSLFDNILDATVASPVLSVVNHSVSNNTPRLPGNGGHVRTNSKLSLHENEDCSSNAEDMSIGRDDGTRHDSQYLRNFSPLAENAAQSSAPELEITTQDLDSVGNEGTEGRARASYYPHSEHSQTDDDDVPFVPATLLAELESRKTQQRARTNKPKLLRDTAQASTLLERDAIAEVKKQARKRGPVNLAWQTDQPAFEEAEDDVPLGVLYANKLSSRPDETLRTPGLLAMREAEDNEPLRRRQERLKNVVQESPEVGLADAAEEKETLGQRRQRLQAAQRQRTASGTDQLDREDPEANPPAAVNSMSAILQSNPQKPSYTVQHEPSSRGLLRELPFGYQAQQQMHLNFMGYQNPNRLQSQHAHNTTSFQYDGTVPPNNIPFPYAPVNAQYLQQQQATLAAQIEQWRSCVW
ncbi:hypothetical protein ABW19_dt0206155 [Dactylella cylindrospora]|nr:hypothetical protein ABW19_dt0206155 [Dactylella cylindrospora]